MCTILLHTVVWYSTKISEQLILRNIVCRIVCPTVPIHTIIFDATMRTRSVFQNCRSFISRPPVIVVEANQRISCRNNARIAAYIGDSRLGRTRPQGPGLGIRCFELGGVAMSRNLFSSDSSASSPSMTKEEAGRKAFDRSNAAIMRNERLERLLQVVDHTEGGDEVGDVNDNENGNGTQHTTHRVTSSLATLLAHAGIESMGKENVPMSPPLHTATTYTRPPDGIYKDG